MSHEPILAAGPAGFDRLLAGGGIRNIAHFTAHNGKVDDFNPLIANSCKAKKHRGHKKHKGKK